MTASRDLAKIVSDAAKKKSVEMHQATVSSVNTGSNEATIFISGSTTPIVAKYVNFTPVVSDTVLVLQEEEDVVIFGKVGGVVSSGARCCIVKTDTASISDSTDTTVFFSSALYQVGATFWSGGSANRIIIPTTGLYLVFSQWPWDGSTAGGRRFLRVRIVTGDIEVDRDERPGSNGVKTVFITSKQCREFPLTAGDQLEMVVRQETGAGLANYSGASVYCGVHLVA